MSPPCQSPSQAKPLGSRLPHTPQTAPSLLRLHIRTAVAAIRHRRYPSALTVAVGAGNEHRMNRNHDKHMKEFARRSKREALPTKVSGPSNFCMSLMASASSCAFSSFVTPSLGVMSPTIAAEQICRHFPFQDCTSACRLCQHVKLWYGLTFCYIMHNGELDAPAASSKDVIELHHCSLTQLYVKVHYVLRHLLVSTPSSPEMRLIRPILYMWSAMLSGPFTLHRIHPVLFVVCSQRDSLRLGHVQR